MKRRSYGLAFAAAVSLVGSGCATALSAFTETMSPGVVNHNPMAGQGREGTIQLIAAIGRSFPDSKATVHDLFATADRVVVRWNFKGTLSAQGPPTR